MNLLTGIHDLDAEVIFIQGHALDFSPVGRHDSDALILLWEFLGRLSQTPGQAAARITHGINDGLTRARATHSGQFRSEPSTSALNHVASGAIGVAVEQVFAPGGIPQWLYWSLYFLAANVGDDLPDFLVGHAPALAVGS